MSRPIDPGDEFDPVDPVDQVDATEASDSMDAGDAIEDARGEPESEGEGEGVGDAEGDALAKEEQPGPNKSSSRHNHRRAGALIGVLLALLGFGIAVQVRSNSSSDSLSNARSDDLIRILDDQDSREARLRQQIAALQATEQQLQASGDRDNVALQQAQSQAEALGILLGTLPATGPGVAITITDPKHGLKAEDLLDVVEELRGAGAEAIQFGPARISTSSAFVDKDATTVQVDGQALSAPYLVEAIGDPQTLETALEIPGGVAATARAAGGDATVQQRSSVEITVTRAIPNPRYATTSGR